MTSTIRNKIEQCCILKYTCILRVDSCDLESDEMDGEVTEEVCSLDGMVEEMLNFVQ